MKRKVILPRALALAALALAMLAVAAPAQEVELNPGYINGDIQLGTETISRATIYAYSDSFSAQTSVDPNAPNASYSLTVQVEPGSSRVWNTYAYVYTDGYRDYVQFPQTAVTVVDGTPSTLDFVEPNPCFLEGTITVTGGELSRYNLSAYQTIAPYYYARSYDYGTNLYHFPLLPGDGYRLNPQLTLTTGTTITVPAVDFDCPAGSTVTVDLDVTAPSSSISGTIELTGTATPDYYRVQVSGPAYKYTYLYPPFGPLNDTAYELTDLPDGSYYMYVYAYLNGYDDYLRFPLGSYDSAFTPANRPEIVGGSTPVVNISDSQAFIEGEVTLGGSVDSSDLSTLRVRASSQDYGYAEDRLDTGTGGYDLLLTTGTWVIDSFQISLYRPQGDPDGYLSESIYAYDYTADESPLTVAAGETAYRDFALPMGSVTISFTVAGGGVLSNPRIRATCYEYDETPSVVRYQSLNSYSSGQIDVTTGQVTIVGLKGDCTVNAQAYVGGSLTSFGQFAVEIEPGVDQEIEIGGPSLTVDVESGFCVDADEITVTGIATDDVEVASVTVNGVPATLTSTGNPSDSNEVSFSATVSIAGYGPHEIVTVATDTADKTATDTRTIHNDAGPPSVSFTPADGATYPVSQTSVLVEGTAADETGIASVTINGNHETVNEDGTFAGTVPLELGENSITVVATDNCQTTTVTHVVTVVDNQPPVAVCQDVTVATGAVCSADADVNNGSSDPDGDPITLTPDPASPYPLGSTDVTLTVDDGAASDSCTAVVTVVDQTAPVITPNPGPETIECQLESYSEPGAEVYDVCDDTVQAVIGGETVDPAVPGSYVVTYDATDASSNAAAQASRTVEVVDTTLPTVACPGPLTLVLDTSCEAQVPALSVTASDACSAESDLTIVQVPAAGNFVGPGSQTVTVTVTDEAGNQAQCQTVLTAPFEFDGFLPPIGGADATGGGYGDPVRSFKLKSTIPVKFRASCAGVPYVAGIHTLQAIHWSSEETADEPIDATPQDAATTGNQFRLTGEEWHYNLDLEGTGMTRGQWELKATLADGVSHSVWIQVR